MVLKIAQNHTAPHRTALRTPLDPSIAISKLQWSDNAKKVRVVSIYNFRVTLTSALRVLVNNLFQESFDITFMENEKSCQNINYYFFLFP